MHSMIQKVLTHYAARLDEYLQKRHHQPEGIAEVGYIGNNAGEKPCKMIITLLSVERETAGGISAPVQKSTDGYARLSPLLLMNLNLILAAVYDEKRYTESLSVLSDTLRYIQATPGFELDGQTYTVEIMTLSSQDINNIWTTLGGQYYPSVVCKLRRLAIDSGKTAETGQISKHPDLGI